MRIKNIELHNFGSYAGRNTFDFEADRPEQRVIVIGGKNGAGKTTLFTAVQVCLYGNFAFGYKTAGKRYLREIFNLVNHQVRIDDRKTASVEIRFQQIDNTDLCDYVIRRAWSWPQRELQETLAVWENGKQLDEDEILNFQNYLIHLIPPDMLKLYFFDGEKIADYFLGEKEINIRDALMVLNGNDTFDILYDQIRRVVKDSENMQSGVAKDYLAARNELAELRREARSMQQKIDVFQAEIAGIEMEIDRNQKEYADCGGITIDEWKKLNDQLKEEEEKRERLSWQRKAYATDSLPFAMLPELMGKVLSQLHAEKAYQTYHALQSSLKDEAFSAMIKNALQDIGSTKVDQDSITLFQRINEYLLDEKWEQFVPLLGLSSDEEVQVQTIVNRIKLFDPNVFERYQNRIHTSLERTKEIRNQLQSTSIENFDSYMSTHASLEKTMKILQLKKEHTETLFILKSADLERKENELRLLKKAFEEQLKAQSVSDVSGKALLLLEELQESLYSNLIQQVEADLNTKFKELIRKEDFFSRLVIDRNFVVHLLRKEKISKADLLSLCRGGNKIHVINVLGVTAVEMLFDRYKVRSVIDLHAALSAERQETLTLPIELDKERLSNGEKQIFVMSLYWAMMNQSKNELPFMIDTPFARIDTEHRANITEHFFKKLTGQLLILSTDEELSSNHLKAMNDQISHVYMLEYGQDKKTHIYQNQYFEV